MTRENIIAWAREAEFHVTGQRVLSPVIEGTDLLWLLERFAALVAAAVRKDADYRLGLLIQEEREACAKVCDAIGEDRWALYKGRAPYTGREEGRADMHVQGVSDGADQCAAAIRARGQA